MTLSRDAAKLASSPIVYIGMIAMTPAITRVVIRNGTLGTAITSSASISSEIRIAPSCAVKPAPSVAVSAAAATSGAMSRVLK